ncbi:hypothetical protein ACU686_33680 [Yinghuangia aomiensis]
MRNLPTRHRTRLHRTTAGAGAAVLALLLVLSACSSGGSDDGKDGVASLGDQGKGSSVPPKAAAGEKGDMVKYAGCMREHGIDMPDPNADGSMAAMAMPAAGGADSAEMKKMEDASNACRTWLPNGGEVSEKDKAAQRENDLKLAKRLREHGMDVPDPQPGQNGLTIAQDASDPNKSDAAFKACMPGSGDAPSVTVPK